MIGGDPGLIPGTAETYYTGPFESRWNATESMVDQIVPVTGLLRNLYVLADDTRPRAPSPNTPAPTDTFTIRRNGVDTTVSCSIASLPGGCSDLVDGVAVQQGDQISLKVVSQLGSTPRWTAEIDTSVGPS